MRLPLLLLPLLAAPLAAQAQYVFDLDTPASSFTWTGDSSLGPIVGDPSNDFALAGTMTLELAGSASQAIATLRIVEADALVTPDISGEIPSSIPGFPPLAEIDITNLRLSATSTLANVSASGSFSSLVTLTVLSGTLTLDPLIGSTTVQDLTGNQSDPTLVDGQIDEMGGTLTIQAPVHAIFTIDDSGTGITADLTIDGDIVGHFDCPAPQSYCVAGPNSVGAGALIGFAGATSLFENDFTLTAAGLPAGQPGIFYYGTQMANQPFGHGTRCVGGALVRLSPDVADGSGMVSRTIDLASSAIPAGASRFYQFWYRDPAAGAPGFNLTNAVEALLCP